MAEFVQGFGGRLGGEFRVIGWGIPLPSTDKFFIMLDLCSVIRAKFPEFLGLPPNFRNQNTLQRFFLGWAGGCAFGSHFFAVLGAGDFRDGVAGDNLLAILCVVRGDLEGVEENAGTFVIHLVVGDRGHDLADGELNGSAVLERRQFEPLKGAGEPGGTLPEAGVEVTEGLAAGRGSRIFRLRS